MNTEKTNLKNEKPALSKGDVSEMLPSDGDIEELALQIEERYNECHFWKRGKIYADGFRNGAKFMHKKAKGNLR